MKKTCNFMICFIRTIVVKKSINSKQYSHVTLTPVHLIQVYAYTLQSYAYASISLGYAFIKIYVVNPKGCAHERVSNFPECSHSLRSSQAGRMYPSNSCLIQDCEKDLKMWICSEIKLFICHGFINSYQNNLRP